VAYRTDTSQACYTIRKLSHVLNVDVLKIVYFAIAVLYCVSCFYFLFNYCIFCTAMANYCLACVLVLLSVLLTCFILCRINGLWIYETYWHVCRYVCLFL
jgi:hypothetical protein